MSKRRVGDDDLAFLTKQSRTPTAGFGQKLIYAASAVAASCVTHYLYMSMFNMVGEENYIIFAVVTLITSVLLGVAYHNVWKNILDRLYRERQGFLTVAMMHGKKDKERQIEVEEENQYNVTCRESLSFSLIYNNLFYYAGVLLLGFFLFRSVPST